MNHIVRSDRCRDKILRIIQFRNVRSDLSLSHRVHMMHENRSVYRSPRNAKIISEVPSDNKNPCFVPARTISTVELSTSASFFEIVEFQVLKSFVKGTKFREFRVGFTIPCI